MVKEKVAILIFMSLCCTIAHAENFGIICGKYFSKSKIVLQIFEPTNGYYNQSFSNAGSRSTLENFNDSFHFSIKIELTSTFLVYLRDEDNNFITKAVIILSPGDSVHLDIDLITETKEIINYTGKNADGHRLFNDLDRNPVHKYKEVMDIFKNFSIDKKIFISQVNLAVSHLTQQFDSLFKIKQISSAYSNLAKISYKQMLYGYTLNNLFRRDPSKYSLSKFERDSIAERFYRSLPLSDMTLQLTYNSITYLIDYYNFLSYRELGLESINDLYVKDSFLLHGKKILVKNECGQFIRMTTKEKREDLWALFMLNVMNMVPANTFDEQIDQFEMFFAGSKWMPYLRDKQKKIAGQVVIEYKLLTPVIHLKDMGTTNSLKEVLSLLPAGKPVVIDLWASWCGPCLQAFQYNSKLDSFLLEKKIEKLYISIDNKGAEGKWKYAIDKYALGGYHVLANKALMEDLKIYCDLKGDDPFLIPRYLLVDGSHKVVLNDAAGPTAIKTFEKQIEEYLLNKK